MTNGFKWWGWNVPCFGCHDMTSNQELKLWECQTYNKVIAYIDYVEDEERLAPFGETKFHRECERRNE